MNRHNRRAATASGLSGMSELLGIAEKLQPYLARIEELQAELQNTTQLLHEIQRQMSEQRNTFLRMFARGMEVPLDTVLALETEIQHAIEISHPAPEVPAKTA